MSCMSVAGHCGLIWTRAEYIKECREAWLVENDKSKRVVSDVHVGADKETGGRKLISHLIPLNAVVREWLILPME